MLSTIIHFFLFYLTIDLILIGLFTILTYTIALTHLVLKKKGGQSCP